jgi:sec-independent protein translocase protein TatC
MLDQIADRRNQQAGAVMGLGEHLEELRRRLIYALLGLVPILALAVIFGSRLMEIMFAPLRAELRRLGHSDALIQTSALEYFSSFFYVCLLAALILGGPWIIYQFWKFVSPGLYAHERRFAYILAPMSAVLTIAGVLMFYFGFLPIALYMLFGWGLNLRDSEPPPAPPPPGLVIPTLPVLAADPENPTPGMAWINEPLRQIRVAVAPVTTPAESPDRVNGRADDRTNAPRTDAAPVEVFAVRFARPGMIELHPKIDQYVNLFIAVMLIFAVAFQVPVVILLLGWVGLVRTEWLTRYRKYVFAGSVILCAVVSPTGDPISLAMLQVPVYMLYELGIILLRVLPASRVAGRSRDPDTDTGGTPATPRNSSTDPNPTDASGP